MPALGSGSLKGAVAALQDLPAAEETRTMLQDGHRTAGRPRGVDERDLRGVLYINAAGSEKKRAASLRMLR